MRLARLQSSRGMRRAQSCSFTSNAPSSSIGCLLPTGKTSSLLFSPWRRRSNSIKPGGTKPVTLAVESGKKTNSDVEEPPCSRSSIFLFRLIAAAAAATQPAKSKLHPVEPSRRRCRRSGPALGGPSSNHSLPEQNGSSLFDLLCNNPHTLSSTSATTPNYLYSSNYPERWRHIFRYTGKMLAPENPVWTGRTGPARKPLIHNGPAQ